MILEEYKYKKTRDALKNLAMVIDASEKEDKSVKFASLTMASLSAFCLAVCAGSYVGVEALKYLGLPFLFIGMATGYKATDINGFEVREDAMYKFIIDSSPELKEKGEKEVKSLLKKFKENNIEINNRYADRITIRLRKKCLICEYADALETLGKSK